MAGVRTVLIISKKMLKSWHVLHFTIQGLKTYLGWENFDWIYIASYL